MLLYLHHKQIVMGASKFNIYSDYTNDIAAIAKVFAHPARVAIIAYISKQNACICNDLVSEIGLSQATISQHLEVINKAGLLKGTYKGNSKCYCINTDRFKNIQDLFNSYFSTTKANCC